MKINFWTTRTGPYITHTGGLSQEQISFLRSLKVGDRLILYVNDPDPDGNKAALTMKKSIYSKEE